MPFWTVALLTGLVTATVSGLLVLLPTALAWGLGSHRSTSFGTALGVGSALWLLAQGAHLAVGSSIVELVPLALLASLVGVTAYGAFRVVRDRPEDGERGSAPLPATATAALLQWWAGYAVGTVIVVLLAGLGPAAPVGWTLVYPLVVVPALAAIVAVAAERRYEGDLVDPGLARRVLPDALRRAVLPALRGMALLVAVGSLVVLAVVGVALGDVRHVQAALGTGLAGGIVLTVAQAGALPNLALWAVSFLAGPGFQVVDGARTTWSGAHSGLLPVVPVFAALPSPGPFPVVTVGVVLVPVLVGGYVGRRALRRVARLSSLRTKASVAVVAALLTAAGTGLLDALGGGRLGTYRLAHIGAPALALAGALAVELTVGAAHRRGLGRLAAAPLSDRGHRPVLPPRSTTLLTVSDSPASAPAGAVVVLVSGSGTNLQALIDACADASYGVRIAAVGADRDGIEALARAERAGIPTFVRRVGDHPSRADWDAALAREVTAYEPVLVVSAGFMRILGPAVLASCPVINTHPALLPSFPGTHGVRDALAHGVKVTGCTCHYVDAGVDTGPIIDQRAVRVEEGDTEETLHERIKVVERAMLVDVVGSLVRARAGRPSDTYQPSKPSTAQPPSGKASS